MENKLFYDEYHDESLDPRVQGELEKLNAFTDEINRLETTLEEANSCFRSCLSETSSQLQSLSKKIGSSVEKARPYYEGKERAKTLQMDCQKAAVQYQRANAIHQAARETISLAEDRFRHLTDQAEGLERKFDPAWQEMLNHATMKVMEAEAQKSASEREHLTRASAYNSAEAEVLEFQKKLKNTISKSQPYYNLRISTQLQLEAQKHKITTIQSAVSAAKRNYTMSLRNLEQISEEIHEKRRANMKREPGVGAEWDESVEETCISFRKVEVENWPDTPIVVESSNETEILSKSKECIPFSPGNFESEMRESNIEGCDREEGNGECSSVISHKLKETIESNNDHLGEDNWRDSRIEPESNFVEERSSVVAISDTVHIVYLTGDDAILPSQSKVKESDALSGEVGEVGKSASTVHLKEKSGSDLCEEGVVYESQSKPYFVINQIKKFEAK